jgi:hypothetical protein
MQLSLDRHNVSKYKNHMTQPGESESSRRATVKLELELAELGMKGFQTRTRLGLGQD